MHSDRVPVDQKKEAHEKFKLILALYDVISSSDKRKLYDEKGVIDNVTHDSLPKPTFKITSEHVQACKEKFKGISGLNFLLTLFTSYVLC